MEEEGTRSRIYHLPDAMLSIYTPFLFTPYQNPKREVLSPHFTDVETEAQRDAKCFPVLSH